MRNGTWGWVAAILAAALGLAACNEQEPAPSGGHAYLIVDRDAREAGVTVRAPGLGGALDALPFAFDAPVELEVVMPGGEVEPVDVEPGAVVHVRGLAARIDVLRLGEGVATDRLVLHADEAAVVSVARVLVADVERAPDGAWILVAPDAFVAAAGMRTRLGPELGAILESFPVENTAIIDAGSGLPVDLGELAERLEPVATTAPEAAPSIDGPSVAPATVPAPAVTPSHAAQSAVGAIPAISIGLAPLGTRPSGVEDGVSCDDPVAGTWVSTIHDARFSDWYEFTMVVRRVRGNESALTGEIRARSWSGGADVRETPAACSPWGGTLFRWTVTMPARGELEGGTKLRFGGTSWSVSANDCGEPPYPGGYNLDQFSGTLVAGSVLDARNSDGGRMRNFPTPFRRVSCGDGL